MQFNALASFYELSDAIVPKSTEVRELFCDISKLWFIMYVVVFMAKEV